MNYRSVYAYLGCEGNNQKMKIRAYIPIVLVIALFAAAQSVAGSAPSSEYQVKAVFLYKLVMFVNWPAEKMGEANEPIIMGIIGQNPFGNADIISGERVGERKLIVRWFKTFEELKKNEAELNQEIEALKKCHLLFFCASEKNSIGEIMKAIQGAHVLTVGDMSGFLESDGVINFIIRDEKVCFEINVAAAKKAGLEIRSQLLRLAKRVIGEDAAKDDKKQSNARQAVGEPIMLLM